MAKKKNNKILNSTLKLVFSALFLAIAILLPTIISTNNQQLGRMFLPMHLPVMLSGFVCGTPYGIVVGFIAPILKFVLSGVPKINSAVAMAFELATYGGVCGLFYKIFPQKIGFSYITLLISAFLGRVVNGVMNYLICTVQAKDFIFKEFISASVITGIPGILLQIAIIPPIILALKKTNLMMNE